MEYVFGTTEFDGVTYDELKTIGSEHSNLEGEVFVERSYNDSIITDVFIILKKTKSETDSEGNCYDWYVINSHYRYIDKYTPNAPKIASNFAALQNVICELTSGDSYTYLAKVWEERLIAGDQQFSALPTEVESLVIEFLKSDVLNNVITSEKYEEITGQPYDV